MAGPGGGVLFAFDVAVVGFAAVGVGAGAFLFMFNL